MIKKIITNDYVYDGNEKDFLTDTYTRNYRIKVYFCRRYGRKNYGTKSKDFTIAQCR